MKLVMKKSAFIELAKALSGDSFEKIKANIIAHLKNLEKKENQSDLKKAIEHFNELERYPHLEKSVTGELIEKAVYGLGTVREWKGKKYKKIAQGKWVRVYDKVDRGAKNAMTRLVHQAEKINTPEEMLQFVLANKQRFVDERTGRPLDIMDRLNAVIDGKNKEESKTATEQTKNNVPKAKQEAPKTKAAAFGLNDIKTGKTVKTVEEIENVARQIAEEYKDNGKKASSVWMDFLAYNLDGGMGGDLYSDFLKKHGDLNFNVLAKKLSGKKLSSNEKKDIGFADEYANKEEEKETLYSKTESKRNPFDFKDMSRSLKFNELIPEYEKQKKILNWDLNKKKKQIEKEYDFSDFSEEKKNQFLASKYKALEEQYAAAKNNIEYLKNELKRATERDGVNNIVESMKKHDIYDEIMGNDKPAEKKKETNSKKTTVNSSVFSTSDSADIDSKQVIAEPVSQEKDRVEFPGTKEIKNEFEQLKRSCSTDPYRYSMNHVYYDKPSGVLVATDARMLKFIKVGDLKGFEGSQFVAVDTKGKNVVLTPQEVNDPAVFPGYKKVIPDKTAGKVKFDNKALVKKLKEMKADGAISRKDPSVNFELQKNGDVLIDGTKIGTVSGRDIKEGDFFRLNSTYILNAISGDSSELNFSKGWGAGVTNDYERAMTINTGCSTSVIMPMNNFSGRKDYQYGRDEKKAKNDKKNAAMEERVKSNERYIEIAKDSRELQPEKIVEVMQKISAFNDENLIRQWKIANADLNSLGKKYDFDKDHNKRVKETGATVYNTIETVLLLGKYPKIKSALEKEMQKRGLSTQVKKSENSLFDYIQKSIGILKDCHAI